MGNVLKRAAPRPARRIEAEVHGASLRAAEILARAGEEARAIAAVAESERAGIRARAAEEGRQEGLARAAATLAAAARERDRRLADAPREIAALAVEVAGVVLGRALAADPAALLDVAAGAVALARDRREVILRVNPSDAAVLSAGRDRLSAMLLRAPGLAVEPDPAVPAGGVVVLTEAGRIDGAIETRLAALREALEEALR
jgi:type III secretion protein L